MVVAHYAAADYASAEYIAVAADYTTVEYIAVVIDYTMVVVEFFPLVVVILPSLSMYP